MAFIEPRLIHLLNDSATPHLAHTDLPPFAEAFPDPADRPSTLEPTAGHADEQAAHGNLGGNHTTSFPASGGLEDVIASREGRRDGDSMLDRGLLGNAPRIPLRLLLGGSGREDVSFSSNIADDAPENRDDACLKKRHRTQAGKDDLMHLPQPVKKQKAAAQPILPPMPPIINGLHEPPPNAALFPPISSNDFDGRDGSQHNTVREYPAAPEEPLASDPPAKPHKLGSGKTRKKAMKPRRKWSEEETNHLLLGVNRHGVGKWTDILADAEFEFNNRTAGDLKDRFRTCCPNELRRKKADGKSSPLSDSLPTPPAEPKVKARTGLLSENILIEPDNEHPADPAPAPASNQDSEASSKSKKTRAHRKKLEDLVELGIRGPFKKSHRRERRPFSEQDDKQILEGLNKYGPAWTKIQRDSRFSLSGRQPTDLRDRVRNKYPEVYQKIEKGLFQFKDAKASDTMEPSVNTSIGNIFQNSMSSAADAPLPRVGSKEELPRWPLSVLDNGESPPPAVSQTFDLVESTNASFMGGAGEMDISRLLLDDSQISNLPVRQFAPDSVSDSVIP